MREVLQKISLHSHNVTAVCTRTIIISTFLVCVSNKTVYENYFILYLGIYF